jgi:hypothetical protein
MAQTPYYPDSSGGLAFRTAAENALRSEEITIEGTKVYGATTDGIAALSTTVVEMVDSSRLETLTKLLKLRSLQEVGGMTLALVSPDECALPPPLVQLMRMPKEAPAWVSLLPQDARKVYALGMSEPSYYEFSAWLEAERHARLELAKSVRSTERGVAELETESSGEEAYSSLNDEKIEVTLRGIRVIGRWRDSRTNLYAVLVSMPRP